MLKGLISTIIAVGSMGAPIVANEQPYNNSIMERVINEPISAVVYDDTNHTITLTADELNNYIWNNLNNYLISYAGGLDDKLPFSYIQPGNYNLNWSSTVTYGTDSYISFDYDNTDDFHVGFNSIENTYNNKFVFSDDVSSDVSFINNLTFSGFDSSEYLDIKSAIELDIQANQPSQNTMPSVSDLFGYITQGVTAFIGSIGEAFNSVVALFWTTGTNAGPTFLGLLMLVSIGAGLIFLAYNVIKKLVYRLRG